jgi:hypothetical protein
MNSDRIDTERTWRVSVELTEHDIARIGVACSAKLTPAQCRTLATELTNMADWFDAAGKVADQ